MKRVLIICPQFPPNNAADMHRVRQSLPYFELYGWEPTVIAVEPKYVEMSEDPLLLESLPNHIKIYRVKASTTKYTRKFGLGNLGIRAFYQLYKKGNELLSSNLFDLVYFSTTMFACMPLGRLWKRKFNIPFVLDIQDPWRNDYYLTVPKEEQPPKFWFAHRLNSTLEKFTIPKVDGLISVSQGYIFILKQRYPAIQNIPSKIITFGAAIKDFEIAKSIDDTENYFNSNKINILYIGRGGHDLEPSLAVIFKSFKGLIDTDDKFKSCLFHFVGTSYASEGLGKKTVTPIAQRFNVEDYVVETTDRIPYFKSLSLLQKADIILLPGSSDKNYTASKLYPNILAQRPILCVFNSESNAGREVEILNAAELVYFDQPDASVQFKNKLKFLLENRRINRNINWDEFEQFTARDVTRRQCELFNEVIKRRNT